MFFNEIYTPIFEEKKILSANERFAFQLLDAMRLNDKRIKNSCKTTAKTHATMDKKINIPFYAAHIDLLITKCGWRLTRVRSDYTFEQSKFKKEFVIMNQVSRQNAQTDVEKEFYKLVNNSNFGYDCRNNADNCFFQPIYDEIEELSYAKRFRNVFDQNVSDFVLSEILERQIEEEFLNKLCSLDPQDEHYKARKNSLEIQKRRDLDAVVSMKKSRQNKTKKHHRRSKSETKGRGTMF